MSPTPIPLADDPKWTDVVSAIGTLAAAVFALLAIGATMWLAHRDRSAAERLRAEDQVQANRDREAADQRLREEREAADQRLREERADAELRSRRERQMVNAGLLLQRISDLQPHFDLIPQRFVNGDEEMKVAVRSLQRGAQTEALALENRDATDLYQTLTNLVLSAGPGPGSVRPVSSNAAWLTRTTGDLSRYARYVRLRLSELIETGFLVDGAVSGTPGTPGNVHKDVPVLGRQGDEMWTPMLLPRGWDADTATDPSDPQFHPAR
ncbi:hypothetical protein LN042_11430 [Kitasatospora sp. RB6PN24]|uniref:hypothetical protein n=1 Tax=Kitasatospora humi TaxID=2893891 RepID=UPI001E5A3ED0|nr:hypothetical protein [Kitasatospora humi]MCC9307700.1 hypothetical protein [Kitasatospora humi]